MPVGLDPGQPQRHRLTGRPGVPDHLGPPPDEDGGEVTPKWDAQVREAYMKSCLTGKAAAKA